MLSTFAQDSAATKKMYRNEFGIDATGFLKQFLNFNQQQQFSNSYFPTYYLTYRRYFKCGNIRFAAGGDFSNAEVPPAFTGDNNKYHNISQSVNARIGWEFVNELSKHWLVYYGFDFRPSTVYSKNDATFWNGGYASGRETKTQIYGLAPVLGFRFKITDRLSILTEASFSINTQKDIQRTYYTPVSSLYPAMPDDGPNTTKKIFSSFGQPLSIFIVFKI